MVCFLSGQPLSCARILLNYKVCWGVIYKKCILLYLNILFLLYALQNHVSFMRVKVRWFNGRYELRSRPCVSDCDLCVLTVVQSDEEMLGGDTWKKDRLQKPDCQLSADAWQSVTVEVRWDADSTSFARNIPIETKSPEKSKKKYNCSVALFQIYSPAYCIPHITIS